MIGGVAVREAPDSMFYVLPANGSNVSAVLDVAARDAKRVQVAVVLTTLVGIIQVSLGGGGGGSNQHPASTQPAPSQHVKDAVDLVYLPSAPTESLIFG